MNPRLIRASKIASLPLVFLFIADAAAHFDQLYASTDGGATWQRRVGLLVGEEFR